MNFRSALRFIGAGVCAMALTGVAWAKVDINHATAEQLQALHGVGPARAQAIIAERRAHGPFKSKADIAARVHGIGPETVNGFAADIDFGRSGSTAAATAPVPAPAATKAAAPMPSSTAVKTPSGAAATSPAAVTAPHPARAPTPAAGSSSTPSQKTSQTSARKANPSPTSMPSGTPK